MMIEPVLYWNGVPSELHLSGMKISTSSKIHKNDDAIKKFVADLRNEFLEAMDSLGAAHLQYGRFYNYNTTLDPDTLDFVKNLKKLVDPRSTINPGALGLY